MIGNQEKFKRARAIIAIAIAIMGFNVYLASRNTTLRAWQLLGGDKIDILQHADSVEAYRVKEMYAGEKEISQTSFARKRFGRYAVIGQGKPLDAAFCRRAGATVLNVYNTKPYVKTTPMTSCAPSPGIAFHFIKGSESVDVMICYECFNIEILNEDYGVWSDGFQSEYEGMRAIIREAFPSDEFIQNR